MNSCQNHPCSANSPVQNSNAPKCSKHQGNVQGCGQSVRVRQPSSDDNASTIPLVDIIEGDNEFLIVADMPGASEETIDVQFNAGELTISGEAEDAQDSEDIIYRCQQFVPTDYYRVFRIGDSVNSDAISANFDNGVLTVRLPKRDEIQPKKISVQKK